MPNSTEPHRSPVKDVVSKMKNGARRVKRFASMSHLPHIGGAGSRRRLVSLDAMSLRPETNIVPLLPPATITTTTNPEPSPHPYNDSYAPSRSSESLERPESDHHHHHLREYSSSSSSTASSSEIMTSNTLEVVGEEPEKVQIVEEDTEAVQPIVEEDTEAVQPIVDLKETEPEPSSSQVFDAVYNEPEVPDPFLIDDDQSQSSEEDAEVEEPLPSTTSSPAPAPPPDVNKDMPPPPPPVDSDPEEEEAPDLYLPGLVLPTMFLPIPNTDPLTTLLTKYIYPSDKRPFRDSSGEWQNSNFNTLVMTNSWRALARMARDRLVTTNPEDLGMILELWYLRLACLARLRLFNQTSAECTNLFSVINGIAPQSARDWVYERLLPFELEVMQTRLNYWAGDYMSYIDSLNTLLTKCRVRARKCTDDPTSVAMWKERGARVALIIASQFMEMKDFGAATKLLEPLCNQSGTASPALRSTVGRIYLQAGQLGRASKHFSIVAADESVEKGVKDMNAALLATANGEWESASEVLRSVLEADAENYAAVNNLAVALLGQGKLKEGIDVLEKALHTSPSSVVVAEPFLFNLSTLYELRSATATEKKRELLIQVAQWSGDGLRTTCLKMPTT